MVSLVRSEDRKPSRRVFPLLQNLDLDSVTFAQLQSTGEPISIEDMNEQEMVDLIIVNLARLAVAGEWTGLLEAGGDPAGQNPPTDMFVAGDAQFYPHQSQPWGGSGTTSTRIGENDVGGTVGYPIYFPFISPISADVSTLGLRSTGTESTSVYMAVYSNTTSNGPGTIIGGAATISLASTTTPTASPASTITLVAGVQYWMGYCMTTLVTGPQLYVQNTGPGIGANASISVTPKYSIFDSAQTANTLPTTAATSGWAAVSRKIVTEIVWA